MNCHYHDCAECGRLILNEPCFDLTGMCMAPWRLPAVCLACTPKPATVKVGYKWTT